MSGLGANSLAVGQKFARIFEVCNTLVYRYLSTKNVKTYLLLAFNQGLRHNYTRD